MRYLFTLALLCVFVIPASLQAEQDLTRETQPAAPEPKKQDLTLAPVKTHQQQIVPIVDWIKVNEEAMATTRLAVAQWCQTATVTQGVITGPQLSISPGSLEGMNFSALMVAGMTSKGTDNKIAHAYAQALWQGWSQWSSGYTISYAAFPSFAAFPWPQAPPTPSLAITLAGGHGNETLLSPPNLARQILINYGSPQIHTVAGKAVRQYADWFRLHFGKWLMGSMLRNVLGTGPVPAFHPLFSPVGVVIGGYVIPSSGVVQCVSF